MNTLRLSLLKHASLLLALLLTVSSFFFGKPAVNSLFVVQAVLGSLYILFSVLEFSKQISAANLPADRFFYFPLSFLSRKFIKTGAFTIVCVVLLISGTKLVFLGGLVLIVILGDVLTFVLRISKKVYYFAIFPDHILFSLEQEVNVNAENVKLIEYRYGIFYLQLQDGKTFSIEISRIDKQQQEIFMNKFVVWALSNKLQFTDEAKEKLAGILASFVKP